ncbi:MAG: GDP-mannose 4,6-dehydratase, partial [Parcubacteria group bacterium]|nr:GDP-mannose 4,6-dehydratase [Parcubacteria group bacterium]
MSILVTGGAGFIGSHVVEKLLEQKQKVICIDDFNSFYDPKYKHENIEEFSDNKNFKLYKQDICDLRGLGKIFKENKIDLIVHLAARAGVRPSIENPLLYYQVNVMGTVNLLEMAKKHGIKNFIFVSSSSVYGNNEKIPFSEDDNVDSPISPYAASKKSGELICHAYHDLHNINIACLRFFTVYGPKGRPDMAPYKFTELISKGEEIQMYGDGTTFRDYTYVDDIVSGVLASIDYVKENNNVSASNGGSRYEIFNLGNS